MNRNFTLCLILAFLLTNSNDSIAQDFVWARSGGSPMPSQDYETIKDMACDKNGNIYILANVQTQSMKIGGQALTGYGVADIMLASYKPDGTLRWYKMIGTGMDEMPYWLGVDDKDGVYLSGASNKSNGVLNIDKDATSPKNFQRFVLIKYDTSGKYQWHRHPEADTLSSGFVWNYNRSVAMDVDGAGNVYWLMRLHTGAYGAGALSVATESTYLLKYSASGAFSYVKPNLDIEGSVIGTTAMTIDRVNSRFYLSGYKQSGILIVNGTSLPHSAFIGCFKLDGSYVWHKTSTAGNGKFLSKVAIDGTGNIYLAGNGQASAPTTPPTAPFNFNGFTVKNGGGSSNPILIKMDKNGNLIWGSEADKLTAACTGRAVAVRNNNEVVMAGSYTGHLEWPWFPHAIFDNPPNTAYNMFVTRFDTKNGAVLDMDQIKSNAGYDEYPERMAADGKGNVYIGGEFSEVMYVNQAETLTNTAGGQTDWFLLKYGDRFPVSVNDNNTNNEVKIYPNPATAQLVIEGIAEGTTIQVMNILGQQVLPPVVSKESKETISMSGLVPGSYLLQLTKADGGTASYRIEKTP